MGSFAILQCFLLGHALKVWNWSSPNTKNMAKSQNDPPRYQKYQHICLFLDDSEPALLRHTVVPSTDDSPEVA